VNNLAKAYGAEDRIWFLNNLMTIRRSTEDGPDGVSIIEFHMPYGDSPPTHVHHADDEIFHLLEGKIRFRVGDNEFTLEAGHTVVAPKGIPHCFRVESPDGARGLNITPGPNFENFVRSVGRPAAGDAMPAPTQLTPDVIALLTKAAARYQMEILGPPMR
jgi:quercetin dioxygenase-like cupin family protein